MARITLILGRAREGRAGIARRLGRHIGEARRRPVMTRRCLSRPDDVRSAVARESRARAESGGRPPITALCRRSIGRYFSAPARHLPEFLRAFQALGHAALPNAGAIGRSYDCNGAM
jgi:hypothetical protein